MIAEAFNKQHINHPTGAPSDVDALFPAALPGEDFGTEEIELSQEQVVHLNEGKYHAGPAATVRLIAYRMTMNDQASDVASI